MDDLTNACRLATENLATPDNSRNCEAPNAGDVEPSTPAAQSQLPLTFTVITGIQPARLTKVIGLNPAGGMRKETSAMLSRGQAQRVVVADLNGLKQHLEALTSAQAVTWGVTREDAVEVCTQGDTEAQRAGAIARTRENFRFSPAPGVMMLDNVREPLGNSVIDSFLTSSVFADRVLGVCEADGICHSGIVRG